MASRGSKKKAVNAERTAQQNRALIRGVLGSKRLFHGTTDRHVDSILKNGILPRGQQPERSDNDHNWKHTIASNPSGVYLSEGYAPYFALNSMNVKCIQHPEKGPIIVGDHFFILEIDTEQLDPDKFYPDEDVIAQAYAQQRGLGRNALLTVTQAVRDNIVEYKDQLLPSLRSMGTCLYYGAIPPEAIKKAAIFDQSENSDVWAIAADPQVSIQNWQFMATKYKALSRFMIGEHVKPEEFDEFLAVEDQIQVVPSLGVGMGMLDMMKQRRESVENLLKNQPVRVVVDKTKPRIILP